MLKVTGSIYLQLYLNTFVKGNIYFPLYFKINFAMLRTKKKRNWSKIVGGDTF